MPLHMPRVGTCAGLKQGEKQAVCTSRPTLPTPHFDVSLASHMFHPNGMILQHYAPFKSKLNPILGYTANVFFCFELFSTTQ